MSDVAPAPAPPPRYPSIQRRPCRFCNRWTNEDIGGICVFHQERDEGLPRTELYNKLREKVGRFGARSTDGVSFRLAYHAGVFACDGPGALSCPLTQEMRAVGIEQSDLPYLLVIMNPIFDDADAEDYNCKRLGSFFDSHESIGDIFRRDERWPGAMDIYVIDPEIDEEMDFLVSIMYEPPSEEDIEAPDAWWARAFKKAQHRPRDAFLSWAWHW